jgi:hypothetical protein
MLNKLLQAIDEYGNDCADRQNLPYKYGEFKDRRSGRDWKDVLEHLKTFELYVVSFMPCYEQKVQSHPYPDGPLVNTTCFNRGGVHCISCQAKRELFKSSTVESK